MAIIKFIVTVLLALVLGTGAAQAAPFVHIIDNRGVLGRVDVANGSVTVIGDTDIALTDIAFSPGGQLFGLSFTNLYRINVTTAAATLVGAHRIPGGNALTFRADGTLFAAGTSSTGLFRINTGTGRATNLGSTGFRSAGDLAFRNGSLFLASTSNRLVRINLANPASSIDVGPFGFTNVFGLDTGSNNVMVGISGTRIFSVNTANGAGNVISNYAGRGLSTAFGASFRLTRLQFSAASYSVIEGAGTATISVVRRGSTAGFDTVRFATSNGSALSTSDYTPRSGTLTFPFGDISPKTFTIPITRDSAREPNETVNLRLMNPTGGALLGIPNSAVLTIRNDD